MNKKLLHLARLSLPKTYDLIKKEFLLLGKQLKSEKGLSENSSKLVSKTIDKIFKQAVIESKDNKKILAAVKKFGLLEKIKNKLKEKKDEDVNPKDESLIIRIVICYGVFCAVVMIDTIIFRFLYKAILTYKVSKDFQTDNKIGKLGKGAEELAGKLLAIFVAPVTEETGRTFCSAKLKNGGIIFTTFITFFETVGYTQALIIAGAKPSRALIVRLAAASMHFINAFVQKFLIKYMGKKGIKVSYIITIIIHGLWNLMAILSDKKIQNWMGLKNE